MIVFQSCPLITVTCDINLNSSVHIIMLNYKALLLQFSIIILFQFLLQECIKFLNI